jgi:hypothetical protein
MTVGSALSERGLRPISDLAAGRPHGVRLRYMAGCRCTLCRAANTQYERARAAARKAGDWNGIVPAAKAREHLAFLSRNGIGRHTISDVAQVPDSVLYDVIYGRKTRIRARTERAILAVGVEAAADGAYIDGFPTWKLINELLADGWAKAEISRQLGYATPKLQLGHEQVTVRNAFDVAKLHKRLRFVNASETLALLLDLSEEGFHRDRVTRMLAELATKSAVDAPDLTVRNGRIRHSTAQLVRLLHRQLTE